MNMIPNDGSTYKAVRAALDAGKGAHNPDADGVGEMLLKAYPIED